LGEIDIIGEYLGGLARNGVLLLSYNQYSLGWKIAVTHVKKRLEKGDFIILVNCVLPMTNFISRVKNAGLDIIKHGLSGNMAVINLFDDNTLGHDFIYPIEADSSTLIPKFGNIMKQIDKRYSLKDRRSIGVTVTFDGIYEKFGKKFFKEYVNSGLKTLESLTLEGYNFSLIRIVNRDTLPKELHSWLVTLSDQVIITEGILKEDKLIENIVILKDIKEDFEPKLLQKITTASLLFK